jgi:hypothetical protein
MKNFAQLHDYAVTLTQKKPSPSVKFVVNISSSKPSRPSWLRVISFKKSAKFVQSVVKKNHIFSAEPVKEIHHRLRQAEPLHGRSQGSAILAQGKSPLPSIKIHC